MAGLDRRTPIVRLLAEAVEGNPVVVNGWVKTSRFSKNVSFVHLYDGSTPKTLQIVLPADTDEALTKRLGVGAAVRVTGQWVASQGAEQALEVFADDIVVIGDSDPTVYPIRKSGKGKKGIGLDTLRTIPHLRPRTNTHQAVFRVRNALAWHIHKFFQDHGFLWIHTPILTKADAEGAGEVFPLGNAMEFFTHPAFLTVSGQLDVEAFAQSHTDVYTFGPTFRAENSHTPRHAAEFWMIEPEMAFADLDDVIALAESFIRSVTRAVHEQCADDFAFFDKRISPGIVESVQSSVEKPFTRMRHADAMDVLAKSGRDFEYPVGPKAAIQTEHERFLAEEAVGGPVFITDYPVEQKAFYMRLNDDGETVAATDLVMPRLGEIIGGSQREERLDVLEQQMRKRGMEPEHLDWYLDLRRYGSTPHGGFGLGFERMLMWMTGMSNIRDVIPYPRTAGPFTL